MSSKPRYTDDEIAVIKKMLANRHTFSEIAKELGRTTASLYSKCHLLGIRSNCIWGSKSDAAEGIQCTGMITIRLPRKTHERLAKHCKRNRVSMNEFVAALIEGQV